MTRIVTSEFPLQNIASPALPLATDEYSRAYQDQFNNVLRLYFTRLQSLIGSLSAEGGVIPPATNYIVADLPSAATSGIGARSFVTNALAPAFGSTVVGGGAVAVPVYSDGTNWKVG
jgi:hypothetical protein